MRKISWREHQEQQTKLKEEELARHDEQRVLLALLSQEEWEPVKKKLGDKIETLRDILEAGTESWEHYWFARGRLYELRWLLNRQEQLKGELGKAKAKAP